MSYPKYSEYVDSEVDWIKNVPSHWKVGKIAKFYDFENEKVSDKEFMPLSVTKRGILPQLETAAKTIHGDDRKRVDIGDFVINSRSDRRGSCGVSQYKGSVSLICHVLKPRKQNIYRKYGHYLFRNEMFSQEFYKWGRGIVDDLWSTRASEMKRIKIPLPSLVEQTQIATFLDIETSKIDQIIQKYGELIELLKEKRISLISQTVTKGLDPDVKMKDSGVEWIGEIPEGWEVKKLKYVAPIMNDKLDKKPKDIPYVGLEHIESWTGVLYPNNIKQVDSSVNKFYQGNVLFGKLRPYLAKVVLADFDGVCTTELVVLKVNDNIGGHFLLYQLLSSIFINVLNAFTYGVKMPRANPDQISNMIICVPPFEEQKEIALYLEKETSKIDSLTQKIQNQIKLLKEYKISLISHAVTGKIDVRGEVQAFSQEKATAEEEEGALNG